ncbi:MAG: biopolymer transporter ExbD [Planctomycetia bacterium]|nr:biopolymer transporter ExbD [Planctomycetia bacterium]
MAKPAKAFDVWFVVANTVYKGVPYTVVADWTQQGRLAATDMVRPTGTKLAWVTVGEHELLADYIPRAVATKQVVAEPAVALAATDALNLPEVSADSPTPPTEQRVQLPDPEPPPRRSRAYEDDEVDMIPLIDISMVLLVFFIMIQAAGALAPVDVPEMSYAGQLSADPDAITITIEKLNTEDVYYSVRVGQANPKATHDKLPTPEAAIAALKDALVGVTRPPEVRIACRKELPRERVYEIRRMLEPLRKDGMIHSTVATVVEAAEGK